MKRLVCLLLIMLGCAYLQPKFVKSIETEMAAEKAVAIYEKGNNYFKNKEYENAITQFEQIIDGYQNTEPYEPALYLTAFSYYKLSRYEKTINLGERFIREFPNSTYYLNAISLVGEAYFNHAEDYKATYYLTKFYVQSQDSTARQKAFARIIQMLPDLTIAELEKLHRLFMAQPIDEHILYNLAQIEAREGKKKEAERDFNLLLRRFPNTNYTYEVEEYKRFIDLGETTMRVGFLLPLTGKFENIGQNLAEIIKIFERDKSFPFSVHVRDTKSDPIEATLAAAKLIDDIHVDFLIAPISSYEAFGVCGFAYGKGIPVVLPMTSEARFESIPLIFTRGVTSEDQARMVARYSMFDLGIRRYAALYPDIERYRTAAESFVQEVMKNNREIVAIASFAPDSITLKKELETIKKREPEAIFLAMDTDMIINTAPQVAYYGLEEVRLLGIEGFYNEKVTRLGEKYVEGAVFAAPAQADSSILNRLKVIGQRADEFSAKFYWVLWQLSGLRNYNRTILPKLISDILRSKEVFNIYHINDGEFVKLLEISK